MNSCDLSLKYWYPSYFTTEFPFSIPVLEFIFFRIYSAAVYSCLKEQREGRTYLKASAPKKRCALMLHRIFKLSLLIFSKVRLLTQSARIRASLFNFNLPLNFAADWFLICLFEHKPESLPIPVAPTREFCVAIFTSKIEATIGKIDDMIGWESDDVTVGPIAAAAKQSLLRLIPHILPTEDNESGDEPSIYRLVLEHGDFGIHNMSIAVEANGRPLVTSLYDWETGCIVPAILSDPSMAVSPVDLVIDGNAAPSFNDEPDDTTVEEGQKYTAWATEYSKVLPVAQCIFWYIRKKLIVLPP
jgi:hypothetical protein